jgi:hypothetical protein
VVLTMDKIASVNPELKQELDSRNTPIVSVKASLEDLDDKRYDQQRTMEAKMCLRRLQLAAKDKNWQENKSPLWVDVNKWVYEARYGKPKVSVDNRLTIDVVPAMETLQMVEQLKALTNKGNQILLNQFNQETINAEYTEVPNGTE